MILFVEAYPLGRTYVFALGSTRGFAWTDTWVGPYDSYNNTCILSTAAFSFSAPPNNAAISDTLPC
jgi:hypothetical protein